jgi:adenylosuccinate lyase
MATRMSDSLMYRHLWTAPELDYLFEEKGRLSIWLDILKALASAQADLGIIPVESAAAIAELVSVETLDLDYVATQTRASSHSTLGLIKGLEQTLPPEVHQYVYYGATVQDVTDTWFGIVMRDVGDRVAAHLGQLQTTLLQLAETNRDTVMVGRTHGQPGAPITFGTKVASWADEVARHIIRLAEGRSRWSTGQLGGAVGVLGFFQPAGLELRARFCSALGLGTPDVSWLTSRDRLAEFGHTLAMVCATLARIGSEIYELQRPEIGELLEPRSSGGVSSITMPQKRNPESSEHLVTLARLVRAGSTVLLEGMDQQHERDGRGWKAEWIVLPEICEFSLLATTTAGAVLAGLEVNTTAMANNLAAHGALLRSEQVLAGLSTKIGKHEAQQLLQVALSELAPDGDIAAVLARHGVSASAEELRRWLTQPATGVAGEQVDAVLAATRVPSDSVR